MAALSQGQQPELNDHLPGPQVLIPRTNLVPADADYSAVTPQMMRPTTALRGDSGNGISASPSAVTSDTDSRKKPKKDSMASAYDAAPSPATSTATGTAGPNGTTVVSGSGTSSTTAASAAGKKPATAPAPKRTDAAVASSAPTRTSPVDNVLPGGVGDAALMDSMASDTRLEGRGPLVITDTDTPPPKSGLISTSQTSSATTSNPQMRSALPQVASAQPNFRATTPPLRIARPPDSDYYNLKAGPALFRLTAGLQTEFNDNIDLSHTDKKWDYGVTPETDLNIKVPLTVVNGLVTNQLTLDLGIGYTYWLRNGSSFSPLATLNMSPGTSVAFSMMAGDNIILTFFDNFNFQSSPIQVADIQGVNAFEVFNNSIGLNAAWSVAEGVTINAGYGYGLSLHPQAAFSDIDNSSHNFSLAGTFALTEATTVGVQSTLARTEFSSDSRDSFWTASVGPYFSHRISEYMQIEGSVGATENLFDTNADPGVGLYYGLLFRHKLNEALSYTIQGNKNTVVGTVSDLLDTTTFAFRPNYQFVPNWTLGTDFFYQHAEAIGTGGGEKLDRYGLGFGLAHNFGERLSGSVAYRYTWKDSNIEVNTYQQNDLTFSMDYAF